MIDFLKKKAIRQKKFNGHMIIDLLTDKSDHKQIAIHIKNFKLFVIKNHLLKFDISASQNNINILFDQYLDETYENKIQNDLNEYFKQINH
jgi:hypothetical protein